MMEGLKYMFRLYSKGCEYAIRAFLYLAAVENGSNKTAQSICRKTKIPESFARKVFQSLVRGGYLEAVPGNGGGYRLCRKPDKVSILEIIKAVDGEKTFEPCILGSSKCNCRKPCLLHSTWEETKQSLLLNLESTCLSELVEFYEEIEIKR